MTLTAYLRLGILPLLLALSFITSAETLPSRTPDTLRISESGYVQINETPGDFDGIYPDTQENEEDLGILPPEDETTVTPYHFHWNQTLAPAALIVAGSVGVNNFVGFKRYVRNRMEVWRDGHYLKFDDYIQYLPAAAYLGLGFTHLKSRGDHLDRLMAGVTAYALMAIAVNVTKYTVREMRPDNSRRNSFPSGHSGTVFTGAELMRLEYGNYVGMAGYAVAFTVGFLRMYNERHWINDILAGAGIGILSARAAYWLLPLERKLFGRDKRPREAESRILTSSSRPMHPGKHPAMVALPYWDASTGGLGIGFSAIF